MAELADDWPSLAPIRTSCSSSSSSYYYYEPNTTYTHNSINSSLSQKADHYHYSFQSPPSSASSHVSFLHSSTTISRKSHSFLSKCFPPRPTSAFPKQCLNASPGRDMRRPVRARASIFRSVASFPGQGCRPGSICGTTTANSGPLNPGQYSGPLKSNASKTTHVANMHAFTMIPANVVGKKKPPDYTSDEPTSPEVTCMGRVRRSKHSKSTWDALLNSGEKLCKTKKAPKKQIECSARTNLDHDLQLAYIPRPIPMVSLGAPSRWRKMISLIKGLPSPYVQRKLRQEDLVIDLSMLCAACGAADRSFNDRMDARETSNGILYICQAGEGEEDSTALQEEDGDDLKHADAPPVHPNCLLLMRNMSGRSKVFHNHDDNGGIGDGGSSDDDKAHALALKVFGPPADQKNWNKKQASSFWKSKKLLFSSSRTIDTR